MCLASIPAIEAIPFWYLLAAGLILVLIDMLLTNDFHLMWVGIAVGATGGANALRLPGELQLLTFVVSCGALMLYGRRVVRSLPNRAPAGSVLTDIRGACGVVLHQTNPATGEARAHLQEHGEWRVVSVRRDVPLAAGQRVRVVDREGLVLIVESES
jgi:membrane protein implicated in regulation of membrane protease activity